MSDGGTEFEVGQTERNFEVDKQERLCITCKWSFKRRFSFLHPPRKKFLCSHEKSETYTHKDFLDYVVSGHEGNPSYDTCAEMRSSYCGDEGKFWEPIEEGAEDGGEELPSSQK